MWHPVATGTTSKATDSARWNVCTLGDLLHIMLVHLLVIPKYSCATEPRRKVVVCSRHKATKHLFSNP